MFKALLHIIFPEMCEACSRLLSDGEHVICTHCRHCLPVTAFHFTKTQTIQNIVYGRVKLQHATALFNFYKQSRVQQLLHHLKYKGHQHIGTVLGQWLGAEIAHMETYNTVDVVLPVPLHRKRFAVRGYNQVANFAIEIAKALGAEYNDSYLVKPITTTTKVFQKRIQRYTQKTPFRVVNAKQLLGKHILLVDDVITTGATLEACYKALSIIRNLKLSFVSIAIARNQY